MDEKQQTSTYTQTSSNFEARQEKWWETKIAFLIMIITPLVFIMLFVANLQISDTKQMDKVSSLEKQLQNIKDNDLHTLEVKLQIQTDKIDILDGNIIRLQTILEERLPNNKNSK